MAKGPIKKKRKKRGKEKKSVLQMNVSFGAGVTALDIALSIRHLSIMLKSALSLSDAIKSLSTQTDNAKLKGVFAEIYDDIDSGMTMAESMEKHPKIFSKIVVSVISIGEQGGTLEKNLLFLADFLKKNHELNQKVKGAMIYPVIVFGLTFSEMLGVMFFILPKLDALFTSFEDIPAFTKFVLNMAEFIRQNALGIFGGLIVFIIAMKNFLKTKTGKRIKDKIFLKFPIIKNLNRGHILANLARTIGILLESGMPLLESLQISTNTVTNSLYNEVLEKVHKEVKEGNTLAEVLTKYPDYFPSTFVKIIEVGEETGTLEENLLYLYQFYAEEVEEMSNNLATLLEPILLIFIGLMIGALAITIIAPVYQLTGSI